MNWKRPLENEMAGYFTRYAMKVPETNALQVLKDLKYNSLHLMVSLSLEDWDFAYAPGKWTVKEVWLHLMDTERIFAYRSLRIGRGDETPLPGFDQDIYVIGSDAKKRTVASIMEEYEAVRNSTISLFENLPEEALDRMGTASSHPISCRAFAFIIPGHERHHIIGLKENYKLG